MANVTLPFNTTTNSTLPSNEHWKQLVGTFIGKAYSPGFVVLSFVVSYIGAWTTLEILNRRTTLRGWSNWFLLAGAALSMGGICIWGMHFIGNRAIILGMGETQLQIVYSHGFTALSFFVPILVVFIAFLAVGSNERLDYARLGLGGIMSGLGVCGMHYLGQAGIQNYTCIYTVANVIGAGFIAVLATTTALGVSFIFRSTFNTAWWKRGLCAVILAGAPSGMHWTASVGTQYQLKTVLDSASDHSRTATTISVIVLSIAGCFILLLITIVAQAKRLRSAARARQVSIATAIFGPDGKLLVTPEGTLPSQKITNSYLEQSVNDTFDISHPSYLWIFRTSHNWVGVSDLIPAMRSHLQRSGLKKRFGAESDAGLINDTGTPIKDYNIIFRELFCTAVADLAHDLNQPIERMGVLFDQIITTADKSKNSTSAATSQNTSRAVSVDLEREALGLEAVGKGQLLFIVRKVDRHEAEHLQAAGFRLAAIPKILPMLAATLQMHRIDIRRHLEVMHDYAIEDHMLDSGVHLAFFSVRASMSLGFDILARKDARNQLPTMQLSSEPLESWQVDFIRDMDSLSVINCMRSLNKICKAAATSSEAKAFASKFLVALEALKEEIDDSVFNDAQLIAKPIYAPCRGPTKDSPPGKATLLTFRMIAPIHSRSPGKKLDFIPLSFFRMRQHVYKNSPDHVIFARKAYKEFAPVVGLPERPSVVDLPVTPNVQALVNDAKKRGKLVSEHLDHDQVDYFGKRMPQYMLQPPDPDDFKKQPSASRIASRLLEWRPRLPKCSLKSRRQNSSEKFLVDGNSSEDQPFDGEGIMVSKEVKVDFVEAKSGRSIPAELVISTPPKARSRDTDMTTKSRVPRLEIPKVAIQVPTATGVLSKPGAGTSKIEAEKAEGYSYVDELFKISIQSKSKV